MAYIDEAIIKLRAEQEKRNWMINIDLSKEQIIYGESYLFEYRRFFDNQIELMIPHEFFSMPEDKAAQKYLTAQKPQVILSGRDYSVNITLNLLESTLKKEQVPLCLQKLKNTIRDVYPATLFYDNDQLDTEGSTVAYMDFKSFSLGGPIYNIMFVTAIGGKPLIGTFNCIFDNCEEWRPLAIEMLKTFHETREEASK